MATQADYYRKFSAGKHHVPSPAGLWCFGCHGLVTTVLPGLQVAPCLSEAVGLSIKLPFLSEHHLFPNHALGLSRSVSGPPGVQRPCRAEVWAGDQAGSDPSLTSSYAVRMYWF